VKPYSLACEQNRDPILNVLKPLLKNARSVLEVGSGTGQHAVYFAKHLPHIQWQTSDQVEYHAGIQAWLHEAQLQNLKAPLALNVSSNQWPKIEYDILYSANVMHIMHWENVVDLFHLGTACIRKGGLMVCYGPFNFAGAYSSESNALFDLSLKQRDPRSGIRNFEDLQRLAKESGLHFLHDIPMPANNRTLVWQKA